MRSPRRPPVSAASRATPECFGSLPTEVVHPRAAELDSLDTAGIVALLLDEEAGAARAVAAAGPAIAAIAERFAAALAAGGRVVYAGAGTSGRLGVLDAAELPPTFGIAPSRVVALLAGGARAVRSAVEGAEDDLASARRAVGRLRIGEHDLVIGIAASGVTRFTLAALAAARARGAATALITCGAPPADAADLIAHVAVGPEVIAGSTRLKAGTAARLALNAISTAAMVRLGKVHRGRMVDLRASNAKLRARGLLIVAELGRVDVERAGTLLAQAGGDVRVALAAALLGRPAREARVALARAGGRLSALPVRKRR